MGVLSIFQILPLLVVSVSHLACAIPTHAQTATILKRADQIQDAYDYVIVGGGTSGLTVGDRLTADGKYTVLVIEHASDELRQSLLDNSTAILSGGGAGGRAPIRMYNITSVPQKELLNMPTNVQIGNLVGGSSGVNGMVFLRGTSEEYDIWAELGGPGSTWNWQGMLPYFKKAFYYTPPIPQLAQAFDIQTDVEPGWSQDPNNRIYASYPTYFNPGVKLMRDAFKTMPGVVFPKDCCGGSNGVYYFPSSMDPNNFTRSYARTGHWNGISRPNYELLVDSKVNKILFDGTIATGVQFIPARGTGDARTVKARKEIILAAGSVHTPQILQLSGIGPSALLKEARIEVKVDLPGVGQNFQDHGYISSVGYKYPNITFNGSPSSVSGPNLGAFVGLPVISPSNYENIASTFESQDPAKYLPNNTHASVIAGYAAQQKAYARHMRSPQFTFLEQLIGPGPGGSIQSMHPVSRGTINIDPKNPTAEPIVDYRALSNPTDFDITIAQIKFIRRWMAQDIFKPYGPVEQSPGLDKTSDEQLIEWIRGVYSPTVFHPIGTVAKTPRERGGCVDEELRVYGTERLRVVDASIMPVLVGATTCQTVYAIAEKAADLIMAGH
ncbi:alcohol oxidase [Lindgomyces ingoldianus]|uniref:Alcohol oxidase n=1 Tax=Lindgomyces ingoldianus TaxID=673940 RepID=A0ACB6RCI0_9PLEO|nr:alcohol oxidase [Lindgomyces ingoldianus]KAF2476896.1 alcohol oxidase [Lindgomyces ingoldianus]